MSKLIDSMEIEHLLDYGCGPEHELTESLSPDRKFKYQAYDAAVPQFAGDPDPADMVVCINTLSDLMPYEVSDAMDKLEKLTDNALFCVVNTERMPLEWWLPRFMDRFSLQRVQVAQDEMCVIAFRRRWAIN